MYNHRRELIDTEKAPDQWDERTYSDNFGYPLLVEDVNENGILLVCRAEARNVLWEVHRDWVTRTQAPPAPHVPLNVDSIEMGTPTVGNISPDSEDLHKPGAKDDQTKPPVGMIFEYFPRALIEVARVAGFGAEKYTRNGWVSVPDGEHRYDDALGRHLLNRWIEGPKDQESKLLHLAHSAWNALAILELALRKQE